MSFQKAVRLSSLSPPTQNEDAAAADRWEPLFQQRKKGFTSQKSFDAYERFAYKSSAVLQAGYLTYSLLYKWNRVFIFLYYVIYIIFRTFILYLT